MKSTKNEVHEYLCGVCRGEWESFSPAQSINDCPHCGGQEKGVDEYEAASTLNTQVGGDHYKKYQIQPLEFAHANNLSFAVGSIIKYVMRYKDKNGVQDLKKAKHLIDFLIEEENIDG